MFWSQWKQPHHCMCDMYLTWAWECEHRGSRIHPQLQPQVQPRVHKHCSQHRETPGTNIMKGNHSSRHHWPCHDIFIVKYYERKLILQCITDHAIMMTMPWHFLSQILWKEKHHWPCQPGRRWGSSGNSTSRLPLCAKGTATDDSFANWASQSVHF